MALRRAPEAEESAGWTAGVTWTVPDVEVPAGTVRGTSITLGVVLPFTYNVTFTTLAPVCRPPGTLTSPIVAARRALVTEACRSTDSMVAGAMPSGLASSVERMVLTS